MTFNGFVYGKSSAETLETRVFGVKIMGYGFPAHLLSDHFGNEMIALKDFQIPDNHGNCSLKIGRNLQRLFH